MTCCTSIYVRGTRSGEVPSGVDYNSLSITGLWCSTALSTPAGDPSATLLPHVISTPGHHSALGVDTPTALNKYTSSRLF